MLTDPEIDFSSRSGVVSHFVWEAWVQNLAAAEAQLAPAIADLSSKAYLTRIVAAYYTLGNYESVTWIDTIMGKIGTVTYN